MRNHIQLAHTSTSTHRVIPLESRHSITLPVSDIVTPDGLDIFREVEERGYFSFHFRGRDLQLTAGRFIGLIPINSRVTIDVRPKLPIGNFARIVELSEKPIKFLSGIHRPYATEEEQPVSILEFLGFNLVSALQEVWSHGLFKVYVPISENSSNPRGRLEVRKTVLCNFARGVHHKVYSRRYLQTTHNLYNEFLKYALWFLSQRLMRTPKRNRELMSKINEALSQLENIDLGTTSAAIRQIEQDLIHRRVPASRRYYERPLSIALTIVAGKGLSLVKHGEDVELSSYVVDFEDIFESYLRSVLQRRLGKMSEPLRIRDGNKEAKKKLFDDKKDPTAQPDIVVDSTASISPLVIVDAKYKDNIERSDINQAITYAVSYRATNAVLVHQSAKGTKGRRKKLGSIGTINLYAYAFDLGSTTLEEEEQAFADSIANLAMTKQSS